MSCACLQATTFWHRQTLFCNAEAPEAGLAFTLRLPGLREAHLLLLDRRLPFAWDKVPAQLFRQQAALTALKLCGHIPAGAASSLAPLLPPLRRLRLSDKELWSSPVVH